MQALEASPIEAATVGGGGEEELWLAQGEALRDPRPYVVHLLGADDLRGERVWIQSQLHVLPGGPEDKRENRRSFRHSEWSIRWRFHPVSHIQRQSAATTWRLL